MPAAIRPPRPCPAPLLAMLLTVLAVACAGADDRGRSSPGATARPTAIATATATRSGAGGSGAVAFDGGDLTLRGDLRLPAGRGPHSAVVLVHGSGPVSRDGPLPGQLAMTFPRPVPVLAELADGLRAAGYAVLTYDKRTCGPFNGCADNDYPRPADDLTIDTFAADAMAAVAHLRSRADIDRDAVAVAGHSQGATLVPGLLLDDPHLVAGVMVAAPFDPVDELLAEQASTVEKLVATPDATPPGVARMIAQARQIAVDVAALRSDGARDGAPVAGATAAFWRSWLRVSDGVPQLAQQAAQPILVVNGGADTNVGPQQTAQWRQLADDGLRVEQLDCVSHALNCLGTDQPAGVDPAAISDHVDPRVTAAIVDFLDAALR